MITTVGFVFDLEEQQALLPCLRIRRLAKIGLQKKKKYKKGYCLEIFNHMTIVAFLAVLHNLSCTRQR